MNYTTAHDYLLGKPEAELDYPFGPEVAVFKVRDKMFATLAETAGTPTANLKCDPQEALILRDLFVEVIPGYHMNKKHWNTITLDGEIPHGEIERMMDNSYALIVRGMTRKVRESMEITHGRDALYP